MYLEKSLIVLRTQGIDVKRVQKENGISVDLVCFTGDMIQRGDMALCGENQWQLAIELVIYPLLHELGLGKERFVFIPGNHEVNTRKIVDGLEKGLQVESLNDISRYLESFSEIYKDRISYFYELVKQSLPSAQMKDLGYTYRVPLNELDVGIACVDSVWRSSGKGTL